MDHPLTFHSSYSSSPLLAKALAFCALANRAVSLGTVSFVERMSLLARCLGLVLCGDRINRGERMLAWSKETKMGWIYARTICANMVNHHSFRNVTNRIPISDSVCPTGFLAKIKKPISMTVFRRQPLPASRLRNFVFSSKPLEFDWRHAYHVEDNTP